MADGASGGATQMSHHSEGLMQKSSRNRKSSSNRGGRSKTGRAVQPAKPAPRASRKPSGRRPTRLVSPTVNPGVVGIAAKASKQAALLDLLKRPAGATIAALSKASGWQQHSVRGFLAGVVRKKLGLELVSAVEADQRIYRIVAAKQT